MVVKNLRAKCKKCGHEFSFKLEPRCRACGSREVEAPTAPEIYLVPVRKGEVRLIIFCTLEEREKGMGVGELHVGLPSTADFPEFRARAIMDLRNLWVMLPSGEYRRGPEHSALGWFIDKVFRFFKQGRTTLFYTDDELVHRTCLLWLSGKTRKRTFLKKVAELLLSGRREEARAILLAWEL